MKPRLLDLFCGAGGAAAGYARAGFEVVGVDHKPQPNYPFEFYQEDALEILGSLAAGFRRWLPDDRPNLRLDNFDAIHASPPCQAYSTLGAYDRGKEYPDLIAETRELLQATGLSYVIENVPQAPLDNPIMLCGTMFGLRVYRHRHFETSFPVMALSHGRHDASCVRNGYLPTDDQFMSIHGGRHSKAWREKAADAMGVPWMQAIVEVCEAIPPAYSEHIGAFLLAHLKAQEQLAA